MKHFAFVEPGEDGITPVRTVMSEEQILAEYFPHWQAQLRRLGRDHLISPELCIEDWIAVHWACEVDDATVMEIRGRAADTTR